VLIVEIVCNRNRLAIPSYPLPRLVTAEQQDCGSTGIEGEENAEVAAAGPEFLHVRVPRSRQAVDVGTTEGRATEFDRPDGHVDRFRLRIG
jgi:hypothetical protein